MICLSVALHNIPLGTTIFSSIDIKKNKLLVLSLTLSSFIGGFIFLLIGDISSLVLAIISIINFRNVALYINNGVITRISRKYKKERNNDRFNNRNYNNYFIDIDIRK